MIPQWNEIEKIHTKIMWCATPEGQEEIDLVTLNCRGLGRGGSSERGQKKLKKIFSGVLPYQGGIPYDKVAKLAIRFDLDETVTLTFNLTQLF